MFSVVFSQKSENSAGTALWPLQVSAGSGLKLGTRHCFKQGNIGEVSAVLKHARCCARKSAFASDLLCVASRFADFARYPKPSPPQARSGSFKGIL